MIFDLIVLLIILCSCVIAFLRGFIREVLTLLGLIGGTAAAVAVGPSLTPLMAHLLHVQAGDPHKYFGVLPPAAVAQAVAYGVIFVLVVLCLSVLSHFMSGWARAIGLGPLNRTFGVLFGLARALLLLGLFYLPIYQFTTPADRDTWGWLQGSHSRVYVEAVSARLQALMPAGLLEKTEEKAAAATGQNVNETRAKLQELELLHKNGNGGVSIGNTDPSQPPPFPPNPLDSKPESGPDNGQGYGSGQRDDMNSLVGKGLNDDKH